MSSVSPTFRLVITIVAPTYISIALIAIFLCYRRRHDFPLNMRRFWFICLNNLSMSMGLLVSLLRFYPVFSCGWYYFLLQTSMLGNLSVAFAHTTVIYYGYRLNKSSADAFANSEVTFLEDWAEQNRFRKIRHRLTNSYLKRVFIIVNLGLFFARGALILYTGQWNNNLETQECQSVINIHFIVLFIVFIIMLSVLYFINRFRIVEENLYLSTEFKIIGVGILLGLISVSAYFATDYEIFLFFDYSSRFIWMSGFSLYPYYKGIQHKRDYGLRTTRPSLALKSLKKRKEHLLEVLISVTGYELLHAFLIKEISSENLIFWKEINDLFLEWDDENIGVQVQQIYARFIADNAPLMINISGPARIEVGNVVENFENSVEVLKDLHFALERCQKQVVDLMNNDSFRRFMLTDEYKKWQEQRYVDPLGRLMSSQSLNMSEDDRWL